MQESATNIIDTTVGIGAGYFTYKGTQSLIRKPYSKYFLKCIQQVKPEENKILKQAAKDSFEKSQLSKKGVAIVNLTKDNLETYTNETITKYKKAIEKISKKNKLVKLFEKRNIKRIKCSLNTIADGRNACFMPLTKNVIVNKDKMSFSTFHELGHSMNFTATKGLGKFLSKFRSTAALYAPVVVAISLLHKTKPDTEKKTGCAKFLDFIKNNCGILTSLCMLPTVMEEGLASINGAKLAKDVLNKDMYKKLNKLNFKAWGSYLLGAIVMGLAAKTAVYVKDKVAPYKSKTT